MGIQAILQENTQLGLGHANSSEEQDLGQGVRYEVSYSSVYLEGAFGFREMASRGIEMTYPALGMQIIFGCIIHRELDGVGL